MTGRQSAGQLPQPEGEEPQHSHPECQPSRAAPCQGLQRAGLVRRLAGGSPGDLEGDPGDQQVQHTADGVADPGADLQGGMALNLGCDTRDIASLRHRSHLSTCRLYWRGSMFLARSGSEVRILRSHR